MIAGVLDRFARGEILAAIATERLTDSEQAANRDLAQARWEEALDSLRASLGRAPGDTPTEWLGAIVRREMPARVFPGGLAGVLRDDNEVVVDRESARRATAAALRRWGTETN
ncbi:MAG TPA: hypothetical protein PLL69_09020 [Gemmatimonadales bacterium]|nr:hypothetical protein [Gemmatimonadales bacterium]